MWRSPEAQWKDASNAAAPLSIVSGVRFGLLNSQDIVKLSVLERPIVQPQQTHDSRLGLPQYDGAACSTCQSDKLTDCPGHFGHLKLATRVYHPAHIHKLCKILNHVCLSCGKLRKNKSSKPPTSNLPPSSNDLAIYEKLPAIYEKPPAFSGPSQQRFTRAKFENPAPSSNYVILDDDETPAATSESKMEFAVCMPFERDQMTLRTLRDQVRDVGAQFASQARACKYCQGSIEYPHPSVSVALLPVQQNEWIQVIQLRAKKNVAHDYWRFLGPEFANLPVQEMQLSADQVLALLKAISEDDLKSLGMIDNPSAFILETIPVPPNCLQETAIVGDSASMDLFSSPATLLLKQVVSRNTRLASIVPKSDMTSDLQQKTSELQLSVSRYLRLRGATKIPNNAEPDVKGRVCKTTEIRGIWKNKMLKILGKVTEFCALAVLTGDPHVGIEEVAIPRLIAGVSIPERVTLMNIKRLQALVKCLVGETWRPGNLENPGAMLGTFIVRGPKIIPLNQNQQQLELDDVIYRPLEDGDIVLANRAPTVQTHSVIGLKVKLHDENTVKLNPLVCPPFGADFDGDKLHIFVPQSLESRAEAELLMTIKKQFQSPLNGNILIELTQDVLVAAYLLVAKHKLCTKFEMSDMAMAQGDRSLPVPAIVKSPKGTFWTNTQAFSLVLPPVTLSSDKGVLIQKGELLFMDDNPTWLRSSSDSLVSTIYGQLGVDAAVKYLNGASRLLNEFLSFEGLSVGLDDFNMTHLKEDIDKIIDKSSGNPKAVQGDVEELIASSSSDNAAVNMMRAGSKGKASHLRQQGACLGLQQNEARKLPGRFIRQSFWNGLDPETFFQHCGSVRAQRNCHRDDVFRFRKHMLGFTADVGVAYDGSVRYKNEQLIQFQYGGAAMAGEAVGVTANLAIAQLLYDVVKPEEVFKYLKLFKELLHSDSKTIGRWVILRLTKCLVLNCHCPESRLLHLQERFRVVRLEQLAEKVEIEWSATGESPWICHIHLKCEALENFCMDSQFISHRLEEFLKKSRWKSFTFLLSNSSSCIHFCYFDPEVKRQDDECIENSLNKLKKDILPALLKSSITGGPSVEDTCIVWEQKAGKEELVMKVQVTQAYDKKEKNEDRKAPYDVVKSSCGKLSDYVDWTRSGPLGVQEVYRALGVEAAYEFILQGLSSIADDLGVTVDHVHFKLLADIATHTGCVITLADAGIPLFLEEIGESAPPFMRASQTRRLKIFTSAAEAGDADPLDDAMSSAIWGKRPATGTSAPFDLFWSDKEADVHLVQNMDIHEFLACVSEQDASKVPAAKEVDVDSPVMDRYYKGSTNFGASRSAAENDSGGWDKAPEQDICGTGWDEERNDKETGWEAAGDEEISDKKTGWEAADDEERSNKKTGWDEAADDEEGSNKKTGWEAADDEEGSNKKTGWEAADEQPSQIEQSFVRRTGKRPSPSPSRDDLEEESRPEKPFKPSGANVEPLGKRRQFKNVEADNDANAGWSGADTERVAQDRADAGDTVKHKPGRERPARRPVDPVRRKFNIEMFSVVTDVREILCSYREGDRLSEEHETFIRDKILVHHPNYTSKVGIGVDHITLGTPHEFESSTCFFVVRRDGTVEDFSYHKCLRQYIQQVYPPEYVDLYDQQYNPKYQVPSVPE